MNDVSTRPATDGDKDFVWQLSVLCYQDVVVRQFGPWDQAWQLAHFEKLLRTRAPGGSEHIYHAFRVFLAGCPVVSRFYDVFREAHTYYGGVSQDVCVEYAWLLASLFHDIGHVLGGYDTTPEGELRVSAFQAGYRRNEDAFFVILFAVLIHTAGVNMAPMKMPVLLGRIAQGELFEEIVTALKRGGSMTTDLGDAWDFWPYMDLPLDLVRERLGVPPLVQDG